ncbi:hypothetical protein [Thermoactinomyces sp. DSM 45892]|uniref:hypothetical protein n=1 Tax=Thermoactinomyces sp. DSM 45892 TaxID=1882753 RepID=UPI0008945B9E|nr:hypothetical protein [Thermoactinomyces sp. DSM 45892]SDZ23292.1 hypothetical protein SAMN05444416_11714 [Thermoactinomyces sp. DSM 45892]
MTSKKVPVTFVYVKNEKSKSNEKLKEALDAKNRAIDIFAQLAFQAVYGGSEEVSGDESRLIR